MQQTGRARGFSLIEILVVVIIIGIVSSIALLSLGVLGDDRELRTEARRMQTLLEVAQDEAVLQGREFGLELMRSSFRFVEYDPLLSQWNALIGDDTLRLRRLPDGVEFDFFVEDQRVLLDVDLADFDGAEDRANFNISETYAPHVWILSSGDVMPFELHILRDYDQGLIILRRDLSGAYEISSDEI